MTSSWEGILLVTGDINIDLLNPESKYSTVAHYKDILQSMDLTLHATKPTRVTPTSKSLVDHIISQLSRVIHSDVIPTPSISDRDAVYAIINACVT